MNITAQSVINIPMTATIVCPHCVYMAGWAQGVSDGHTKFEAAIQAFLDSKNHGDNPDDQAQIKQGIEFADEEGVSCSDLGLLDYLSRSIKAEWDAIKPYNPPVDIHDTRRHNYPIDPINKWHENLLNPTSPTTANRPDPKNTNTYRIVWYGYDPLTLDLDGDGIETIAATSGVYFDHNADGIQTTSGWIKADDGLLVRDINGNGSIDTGRELFGDNTRLANGQTAAQGFAALKDLDSNNDGKIDANDTAFGELKVWRDLNQDGISQTGELFTLADAGMGRLRNLREAAADGYELCVERRCA